VDAEIEVAVATTRLVRFSAMRPATEHVRREEENYWLDLCLTPRPRNARACYPDRWGPNCYKRIGNVFVLPPRETMQAQTDGGPPQASVLCHLRPEPFRRWFDGDLEWTDCRLEAALDIPDVNIRRLLLRLAQELRHPGFAMETMVELVVAQLVLELSRYCVAVKDNAASGGLAPWRMRLIDERLRDDAKTATLSELAALCNMSVRQLTRAFRASRGVSIGDHVAQRRIDNAKRMLATDESIKAVAYALGFSSTSSFSFAFRRATGQTPREFQVMVLGRQQGSSEDDA
jgi:AraC family transcriptional regulator